ncbi:MAG: hypothetical protein WCL11_05090, partial [Verrucomicrobiota bacterium]
QQDYSGGHNRARIVAEATQILLDRGILVQDGGGGRNTSYRLVEPEGIPAATEAAPSPLQKGAG